MNASVIEPGVAPTDAVHAWRFDHVNVSVGGEQSLRTLFVDVMGLQPGYRPAFPFPGLWLYENNQAFVHAVNDAALQSEAKAKTKTEPEAGAVRFEHIAFRSDQPAAPLIERLRRSGLPFGISRVPQEKTAQIFVLLPGNYIVELDVPDDATLRMDYVNSARTATPAQRDF